MTNSDFQRPKAEREALEQLLSGLTAVRGGDFGVRLDVTGDPLTDEIAAVFNGMVGQLDLFTSEVTRVAREVGTEGKLGGQAHVPGVAGTWEDLTESVNAMAGNLTTQVRNISQVATAVARGDLTQRIAVDARGEILELKTTLNTMVGQLSSFSAEVTRVAHEVGREGRLGAQAEVEGVAGTWKRLTENVNELASNLTRQVRAISEVARAVAAGDLTRLIAVEAAGEVAELKDNINAMVRSLRDTVQASHEQDWLKSNMASISGMLQGNRDLEVVADLVMERLAPLVGAQHGTFFVAEPAAGETRLRLIAGYGLRADKDAPIQYRIGQSLIGQVAKSKRLIVVDQIPQGYIKISSGLGEAAPANLAILPLLFEDEVLGVVELASFTPYTPVQVELLEQLTETLGVSVNAIVANSRTDELLAESQRLTAELQARSEELQRSNTDLEEKAAQLATQKQDIEAKNAEIELARTEIEERARQLALASQYKSQFLANMSHELRTPLNSLLILARLLAQNPGQNLTPKQVEYANVIHSAGSDLLQLINDILDLSKVEAGRMDIRAESFTMATLLDDIQATFKPLTAERGLDFTVRVDPSAPAQLTTDRQRLRQVLGNLLSNAVKFTDSGGVTISVASPPDDPSLVAFGVTDTGIGIAPENLAVIFGAFQQGDGTLNRRYGGTGLGLSIARDVADLLGGAITAESDLGKGSTFTLFLPHTLLDAGGNDTVRLRSAEYRGSADGQLASVADLREPATLAMGAPAALPAAGPDGGDLLVVEGASGGLLSLLAHSATADIGAVTAVVTAAGPDQGIKLVRERPVRCVVVDLDLPAALDFIERLPGAGARDIPVLAHGTRPLDPAAQARLAALRSAARPLAVARSLDELREMITTRLAAGNPDAGHGPSPATAGTRPGPARARMAQAGRPGASLGQDEAGDVAWSPRGRKVLVIDDDTRNVFAISSALEQVGMTVVSAPDGQQGIDALLATPETDLILMDVMMPGMDGYATMTAIRNMPQFAGLPIIAVTARAMPGDRDKSLDAGASEHVTKPVDTKELLACIERLLGDR
jgi:signal transduction histidine kinase/CheY-like chemotaxis protein/HAMP domain-containing protein